MPLALHLFIHFSVAILSGYLAGRYFKNIWLGIIAGFLGGCLIDFDHVLEYFFVYGLNFNLLNFLAGKQFLRSDKIYIVFHAWEWLVVLSGLVYLLRKRRLIKIFLVTLILAMFIHLISDVFINRFPIKFYSISYRYVHNFSAPELLSPEQWAKNLELKKTLSF